MNFSDMVAQRIDAAMLRLCDAMERGLWRADKRWKWNRDANAWVKWGPGGLRVVKKDEVIEP